MPEIAPIKKLLITDMNRRTFLGFVGSATLVVTGAAAVFGGVRKLSGTESKGYGASSYGEVRARQRKN